jgi:hypothetical protein
VAWLEAADVRTEVDAEATALAQLSKKAGEEGGATAGGGARAGDSGAGIKGGVGSDGEACRVRMRHGLMMSDQKDFGGAHEGVGAAEEQARARNRGAKRDHRIEEVYTHTHTHVGPWTN